MGLMMGVVVIGMGLQEVKVVIGTGLIEVEVGIFDLNLSIVDVICIYGIELL